MTSVINLVCFFCFVFVCFFLTVSIAAKLLEDKSTITDHQFHNIELVMKSESTMGLNTIVYVSIFVVML